MRSLDQVRWPGVRALVFVIAGATACSVPDKQQIAPDGGAGGDAGTDAPPADSDAPETTIDQGPDAFSRSGQVTFRFSSSDPGATFQCLIDAEMMQPCRSPYVRSLADGAHNFLVRAVDTAGNSDDTPAERVWTIDTVAPDTRLLTKPPAADNSVMVQFTFNSPEANVTFDCSLDDADYAPCTSGALFGPVGSGAHSFAVRAHDRAGNVDPAPAIHAWLVDTSTPDTQITDGPSGATASTGATFTFLSPDAGDPSTFLCSVDGGPFAECASPRALTGLREGQHSFAVRVRDVGGNLDPSPATRSWSVDLTPPDTALAGGPTGTVLVASASFTFTANEAGATFACSLDDAPFTACMSPGSLTGLGQGMHSFAVRAIDAAGHVDPTPATRTWTVDTVAPDVTFTAGPAPSATSGPRVVFAFTVNEGTVACSFDNAPFAACTSPVGVNLPAGPHQFTVRATDGPGNVTSASRSWTVACSAPDPAGAAGVLHLDDTGQTLANAVPGGAAATLGDTIAVEPGDPAPGVGRFAGGLSFTAAESDHVAWPAMLGPAEALTIELWSRPGVSAGARDLVVSGDGRVALRVTVTGATVRFSISVADGGPAGQTFTVTSAAVDAGAWHHVLASLQSPTLRLWVDGARTEVGGVQLAPPLALDALRLGGDAATAYEGALDEVWLATTAITGDEPALGRYCPQ